MERLRRALPELASAVYIENRQLLDLSMLNVDSVVPREMPIPDRESGAWIQVHPGSCWGGYDQNAWFHASVEVSDEWIKHANAPDKDVVLRLILGKEDYGLGGIGWPEGLLYVNKRLHQGINRHHPDVLLRTEDVQSGTVMFDVRVWSGLLAEEHCIETAEISLLHRPTERLYHLFLAGADLVDVLDGHDPLLFEVSHALDAAYDVIEFRSDSPIQFYNSVHSALEQLETRLRELRSQYGRDTRPLVTALGHGHLDVAWLWQTRHTREKTARTFAIATALMESYPEYVFMHTTSQVFAWLKDDYPVLYERVRARVREGRFEAAGAMWVESDCILVSGESLIRQIHYGQLFMHEEFDREYSALWLPDAFGFSAALPQILLRTGIPVFMTTKLSWSETNRIPADTFRWRGIDGSAVLAHFMTTPAKDFPAPIQFVDTYHASITVPSVIGLWQRYRQKDINSQLLMTFGHSDGGAGPTRQQLEHARAVESFPGIPELRIGRADEFLATLRTTVEGNPKLPTWDGELYLEYHRGTYTAQAWLKRLHRQLENKLLMVEWLDAWLLAYNPNKHRNLRTSLNDAWRTLLLHQFHDILPGTSIANVYEDSKLVLNDLAERLEALAQGALSTIFSGVGEKCTLIVNPSPFQRTELLALQQLGEDELPQVDGRFLASQPTSSEEGKRLLVELPPVSGRSYTTIDWVPSTASKTVDPPKDTVEAGQDESGIWVKNAFIVARIDANGEFSSLRDRRFPGGRELIPFGARGNQLVAYEDLPRHYDAWNLDASYVRKPYLPEVTGMSLIEQGPLRASVHVERHFRSSLIIQRIMLYRLSPRIDFETCIYWKDHHILLKATFPLDLKSPHATCEIQFGVVERPLNRNTSWEQAKFEIPAHRWVDLSEGNYGVSLLNDGRYGHDIVDGRIGLTLLRSPAWPDPQADQGEHRLIYSLFPHLGDWRTGGTVAAAYALNRPLIIVTRTSAYNDAGQLPEVASNGMAPATMFMADPEGVIIEVIKRAQDGEGVIVRLYESFGSRTRAVIRSGFPLRSVIECDLMENPLELGSSPAYTLWIASEVASHDAPTIDAKDRQGWSCEFRPFEIRTFRVTFAQ